MSNAKKTGRRSKKTVQSCLLGSLCIIEISSALASANQSILFPTRFELQSKQEPPISSQPTAKPVSRSLAHRKGSWHAVLRRKPTCRLFRRAPRRPSLHDGTTLRTCLILRTGVGSFAYIFAAEASAERRYLVSARTGLMVIGLTPSLVWTRSVTA